MFKFEVLLPKEVIKTIKLETEIKNIKVASDTIASYIISNIISEVMIS